MDFLHGGHLTDARALELEPGAADWRLLLQVDSDDAAAITCGDAGRVYFWIKQDDPNGPPFRRRLGHLPEPLSPAAR